jgi:hypothetical protein
MKMVSKDVVVDVDVRTGADNRSAAVALIFNLNKEKKNEGMFEPMPMIAHVTRDRDVITTTIKMTT